MIELAFCSPLPVYRRSARFEEQHMLLLLGIRTMLYMSHDTNINNGFYSMLSRIWALFWMLYVFSSICATGTENPSKKGFAIVLILWMKSWDLEKLSDLPKIMLLFGIGIRAQTELFWFQSWRHQPLAFSASPLISFSKLLWKPVLIIYVLYRCSIDFQELQELRLSIGLSHKPS